MFLMHSALFHCVKRGRERTGERTHRRNHLFPKKPLHRNGLPTIVRFVLFTSLTHITREVDNDVFDKFHFLYPLGISMRKIRRKLIGYNHPIEDIEGASEDDNLVAVHYVWQHFRIDFLAEALLWLWVSADRIDTFDVLLRREGTRSPAILSH